jgi:hypothetical protein
MEEKYYVKSVWCVIENSNTKKIKVMPGKRQFRSAYQFLHFQDNDLIKCEQFRKDLEK